jgi:hypothetical protein
MIRLFAEDRKGGCVCMGSSGFGFQSHHWFHLVRLIVHSMIQTIFF